MRNCSVTGIRNKSIVLRQLAAITGLSGVLCWGQDSAVEVSAPAPAAAPIVTTVSSARAIAAEESAYATPVKFRGVVTAHVEKGFDFQDQTGGIFVRASGEIPDIGTVAVIEGRLMPGDTGPLIDATLVETAGKGKMPRPMTLAPEYLLSGAADHHWVQIDGVVVDAKPEPIDGHRQIVLASGLVELPIRIGNNTADFADAPLVDLIGNRVKIEGTCGPSLNDNGQRIGSSVTAPDLKFVKNLSKPPVSITALTPTPMAEIRNRSPEGSRETGIVKTSGFVTTVEDEETLVVQDAKRGMRVRLAEKNAFNFRPDDAVTVTGFPGAKGFHVELRYGRVEKREPAENARALPSPEEETEFYSTNLAFSEVTHPALLVEFRPGSGERAFAFLEIQDRLVRGVFAPNSEQPETLLPGSVLQVTGVKMIEADANGDIQSAWLSLRSPEDLLVISQPSWWTPVRYVTAIVLLAGAVILGIIWLTALRRQVTAQTAMIEQQAEKNATLEERNRIARELHDTLSQGFAGVGFQLASVENDLSKNPNRAHEKLELAKRMVEHSMAEARQSLT
ncbi:MAG: hypothetical protein HKN23_16130, partial [Verrucomicrobiales bacterium]|nr:hypothetical protein [Verrucomicrobiales bacterium]